VELGREAVCRLSPGTELEFFKNPSTETERHTHRLHSVLEVQDACCVKECQAPAMTTAQQSTDL
jgi:hypothetical protein